MKSCQNPKSLNEKMKNKCIQDNLYHSSVGKYKSLPVKKSLKWTYTNYQHDEIENICNVSVSNQHSLDIALQSSEKCSIMYPLGSDFNGLNYETREGIFDENIILRTNYAHVIKKQNELFISKKDNVIYSDPVYIFRDVEYNPIKLENVGSVAVSTLLYKRNEELIEDKDENEMLSSTELLTLQMNIESVFQLTIVNKINTLIIPVMCGDFGVPIDDQLLLFNMCIMKYGDKINNIIISVPVYDDDKTGQLFNYVNAEIVKPHIICGELEMQKTVSNLSNILLNSNKNKNTQSKQSS
jgi:hypothetical protein